MTENALPRASESLAEGNGSIGTVVADLQRLVPGWNVVENGPLGSSASASPTADDEHLSAARTLVFRVLSAYWEERLAVTGRRWPLRELPSDIELATVPDETRGLAQSIGKSAAQLNVADASYLIGVFYTTAMPAQARAELGAYYTPPALCERLLDMATEAGVDWRSVRVLDPACGGGAFLSPVAKRMAENLEDCSPSDVLENIRNRLQGFEIDPFAAWMSQVFLDITLSDLCRRARMRLPFVVRVCNALEQTPDDRGFGLVVGNPPYGRVTLSPALREKFRRGLFGHANLYGVFTDLALRFARHGSVIAYVTPTSFLGGEYFKALRSLLPHRRVAFRIERERRIRKTGKVEHETVHGLTSLPPDQATSELVLALVRGHWSIENRLHHVRDVSYDEDRCRVRSAHLPRNLACLTNLAISIVRLKGRFEYLPQAHRHYARRPHDAVRALLEPAKR